MQIIGLDVGYGYTKAVSTHETAVILSMLGPAIDLTYHSDLSANGHGITLELNDGQRLFVGERARMQSPNPRAPLARQRDAGFVRLMALAAMHEVGLAAGEVHLVTGLPVQWYVDHETLEQALVGRHTFAVNGAPRDIEVVSCKVVPQPFGTFYRAMIDARGVLTDPLHLKTGDVAVVDVGTLTSDFAWSEALAYRETRSGSIPVATAEILRGVQRILRDDPYRLDLELAEVERDVRQGYTVITGNRVRLADLTARAAAPVADKILDAARDLWGDARRLSALLVTGGGGALLFDRLHAVYPHARLVDSPQTANAEGFHRLGLLQMRSGG